MKVVLDACVLFPTVMRDVLLGAAKSRLFVPIWSARILEEWARATTKLGAAQSEIVKGEIALLHRDWPNAVAEPAPNTEATLFLPDPNDVHVLATAIQGGSHLIVTMNLKDFPKRILAEHDIMAIHPDKFLVQLFNDAPRQISDVVQDVRMQAITLSKNDWSTRHLLKKARLPRLAKALASAG